MEEAINKTTRKQKLQNYMKHPGSFLLAAVILGGTYGKYLAIYINN